MRLEVNDRGNLFVPSSRLIPLAQSCAISAASFFFIAWLNGFELEEVLPSPWIVIGFLVLCVVTTHLLLSIQTDLEFDDSRQQVTKGKRTITPYHLIRQVELRRGQGDEALYTIVLRLGVSRSYEVLYTQDEADASLDAAAIARVVNRPVVVV